MVEVPEDWRGYDQNTRSKFFGVIEIPVPVQLLEQSNEITVDYPDSGGHVSSVAMQVWEFSSSIRDVESEPLVTFSFHYDASEYRFDLRTFGESGKDYTVFKSSDLLNWSEASETKSGEWDWIEFDGDAPAFFKIQESDSID